MNPELASFLPAAMGFGAAIYKIVRQEGKEEISIQAYGTRSNFYRQDDERATYLSIPTGGAALIEVKKEGKKPIKFRLEDFRERKKSTASFRVKLGWFRDSPVIMHLTKPNKVAFRAPSLNLGLRFFGSIDNKPFGIHALSELFEHGLPEESTPPVDKGK